MLKTYSMDLAGRTLTVETGKTFPYLDKLENAILQTENGKQVIVINQYQVQPDNDQNQECPNESE